MPLTTETSHGDQEREANSLLVELDKGLRCGKVGEQCEAIVRFPWLFEKHPFPILVNAAFLKLADVFREGTNLMRLCVLKVAQQSEKHLDKIINVDEFLQKIYYVIHSNDPVARAITLRTLGSFAHVVGERKNVHHSIVSGLDSHDSVELEAAIMAAEKLAPHSKDFVESIFSKLSQMLEGLSTPYEIKLKIIPIMQHMHHHSETTNQVRSLCVRLLESYPSRAFVLGTLHSLSQLAAKALLGLPQQVDILISYLLNDLRLVVKIQCLKDLLLLAKKAPHMWTSSQIRELCEYAVATQSEGLQAGSLTVLVALAATVAVTHFTLTGDEGAIEMCCAQFSYHPKLLLAALGCELFTLVALHNDKGAVGAGTEAACLAVENVLVLLVREEAGQDNSAVLKQVLKCVVRLCEACPQLTDRFVDTIISTLQDVPESRAVVLCECLAALSSRQNALLHSLLPDLLQLTRQRLTDTSANTSPLIALLTTLLLQACVGGEVSAEVCDTLEQVLARADGWLAYRVARQATRYGHHQVASRVLANLQKQVWVYKSVYWLRGLRELSLGECELLQLCPPRSVSAFLRAAQSAQTYMHSAAIALQAASSTEAPLAFQCAYVRMRGRSLQAHAQLVKACCCFQTSPPPAIAATMARTTGQETHRSTHIVAQLQRCGKQFEELQEGFLELYRSAFDADPHSLANIQLLEKSCQVVIYVLETLLNKYQDKSWGEDAAPVQPEQLSRLGTEHAPRAAALERVLSGLQSLLHQQLDSPLAYQHIEYIKESVIELCCVPVCVPRFFFQKLQSTEIKLAISPQGRNSGVGGSSAGAAGDQVSVHFDTHLALKVEGVIERGGRCPALYRTVKQVQVCVHSTQSSKTHMVNEPKVSENPPNNLSARVAPHNDYFSAQFLLAFHVAGMHTVHITTQVVDEDEQVWNTGPEAQIQVKSYDEGVQRQQQQQYAAHRQQQRAALLAKTS